MFVSGLLVSFMELHHYIIIRSQIVIVPFALYVCAMACKEKMSSGNADITFVSNCDHNYNYTVYVQATVLCSNVYTCYIVLWN